MLPPRARWAIAIGGGLLGGLLIVGAFAFTATTTTTITITGASAGAVFMGEPCAAQIERAGEPDGRWNATLVDGLRFEIQKPARIGSVYGYRVEVIGAAFAPLSPDGRTGSFRAGETMCRDDGGQDLRTPGGDLVARGNGTLYAAFWSFTAP